MKPYLNLTTPPQLPPGYELKHTYSYPEGLPKSYITCEATGGILAITGEGDNQTVELSTVEMKGNQWQSLDLFPRFATHAEAVQYFADVYCRGEEAESLEWREAA